MPGSDKKPKSRLLKAPKSGVTVRMYNAGFGDCFLLAFRASNGSPRYMLIDCGIYNTYTGGKQKMQLVANDIAEATHKHLHIVAVTHEHADHLYGFRYARDIFDNIQIDDLWLAWTEDPADKIANQLKNSIKQGVAELTSAINRLAPMDKQYAAALQGVLDFEVLYGAAGEKQSELDYLRTKSPKKLQKPADYRRPGEVLTIGGVNGVRIHVLGPPRNVTDIRTVELESEMYPEFAAINKSQAFTAALKAGAADLSKADELVIGRSCPFDERYILPLKEVKDGQHYEGFFQKSYGFTGDEGQGPEWRRIDADWLAPAEELALKINDMTNNTSLVLAIELTDSQPHKVLLFTGDAQIGNWLSWHRPERTAGTTGTEKITAEDLLHRTVLYKVGHHGSRNATPRQKGLEMMDDPGLVAMIPVDQKWANDIKHWEHPAEKLLNRLMQKTHGRVIRSDRIPSQNQPLEKPDEASESEWQAFCKKYHLDWDKNPDNLWIQCTVDK